MVAGQTLTITTGSMDRLSNLRRSLATWSALAEPDHIVVVDWGSRDPLRQALRDFQDPRIIVASAPAQRHWQNSKCHNLEFLLANQLASDLVLRLDNDCLVQPNFFDRHPARRDTFYTVDCHSVPAEIDDKRNLCGTLFTNPEQFWSVNGYNERLSHYGYEDEDLYQRIRSAGYRWLPCDLSTLDHIPHDDTARFAHLSIADRISRLSRNPKESAQLKSYLISKSRLCAKSIPWGPGDKITSWKISTIDDKNWTCTEEPQC